MAIRLSKNPLNIHPIYSPRTSYKRIKQQDEKMIADMTLNFDKLTINMLKEQFLKRDDTLTLHEFITLASKHLRFWQMELPNRQERLVRYLTYLFNEIDINGNGDMQWQEFTNYIIEKATVLKNLKSKNDEIKHYIKSEITPKVKIDTMVHKLEYIPDLDRVAYYEEASNVIYFINAQTGQPLPKTLPITPKQLIVNISSVKKQKTGKVTIRKKDLILPTSVRALDMLYLPDKKYKILAVSTSDGFVRGWKCTQTSVVLANQPDNQEEPFQHNFGTQIYSLAWDSINEVLYCGQKNGEIFMWNLKTDLEKALLFEEKEGEEKPNSLITCMTTMPKLQFMASGHMDGTLVLWDTINSKWKHTYREHLRGILSIAFNETMILLFSAGFDHKICIWNPYIPSLIHKIQGHLSSVYSLRVIEASHQLISMDSDGIVKITDTRRFNIISSFSVESQGSHGQLNAGNSVNSFIAINKPAKQMLRLVFGGKSLWFYDYDKNYNPVAADQNTVISCRYVKDTLCIFTPTGNKIKVWSALNGDVQKIYMDITPHQISAFDFDFLKKRMLIGDTKGNIALYNTANGAKMKTLTKHTGEITHLLATQHPQSKTDVFISYGLDNEVKISRQTEESFEVIRTIYLRKEVEVTCMKFCPQNKIIMMSTNASNLSFFDIQTGKNIGNYEQKGEEFTSITRISKEVILSTSLSGNITLVGIPPFPYRFQKLMSFKHMDPEKAGSPLGLRFSCYNSAERLLYVIDQKIFLTCYQFSMFEDLEKSDVGKQKLEFQRKNLIKGLIDRCQITMKWQVKAHTQSVRVLEFIEEDNILMTSSFDKKVKIWNASTGEYIDSLQQNYNKTAPEALSFYDSKKKYLYTKDRHKAFEGVEIAPTDLDFNPFIMNEARKNREREFPQQNSNKEWNLNVDFDSLVQKQIQDFTQILKDIGAHKEVKIQPRLFKNKQNLSTVTLDLIEKKNKLLQDVRNEKSNGQMDIQRTEESQKQKQPRKMSTNYFRRSMVKCIQSFVDKNESNGLMEQLKSQKQKVFGRKKHLDYIPIYKMVNQSQQSVQEMQMHKHHVIGLASRETENIINSRKQYKIFLNREQSGAANKLFGILKTTEGRTNHLPVSYLCRQNNKKTLKKDNRQPCQRGQQQDFQIGSKKKMSAFQQLHKRSIISKSSSMKQI